MMLNPRIGQQVQIWYNKQVAKFMPYHSKIGIVRIAGKGHPRNHKIEINGEFVIVPCGNCRKIIEAIKE